MRREVVALISLQTEPLQVCGLGVGQYLTPRRQHLGVVDAARLGVQDGEA